MLIKIVPDAWPNADGKTVWVFVSRNHIGKKWGDYEAVLGPFIPTGWHLVSVAP